MASMTKREIASLIDHTLLNSEAKIKEIILLCQEAIRYGFASVCVNPCYVPVAALELKDSAVKISTVIGFPLGANTSDTKVFETIKAIENGADEIDAVINVSDAKDGRFSKISSEIAEIVQASKEAGVKKNNDIKVKIIIETCLLDDDEIESACLCAKKAGADYIETSTGFANPKGLDGNLLPNGASEYHVRLIRKIIGNEMGIKASAGIRSARMVRSMITAGATRFGISNGPAIVENWTED